ncbi:hypothetical protein R1479_04596 [Ralstonia mannitolilytica]|uniref:hypothetical protein n=1 Tax=Ralstonia mannitolilytica TaxID=105219 RepID=UPI0028F4CFB5|nr:hypothetical protein [Ralstonia mannitolilytica]CAJ0901191.1 hypothetical protein R1479_04596 [Ralstonia mannitolilytica]
MSKTFKVAGSDGPIEAEQLGTFAFYIQNIQFRFVVTRLPGAPTADVTHRASGKRICAIPFIALQAAVGDYIVAAKGELRNLVDRVGEARVRSVLAAAE